ncbi:hypothetical protein VE00_10545 [Pseudogymnoascus sp. WSF 3629]|nr:hypothetical protein VE00_10545 [Pseudogymnoascus sp. WSF 3629]
MLTAYDLMLNKAEHFAKNFSTVVDRLTADFQQLEEQHRRCPAQLPKALLQRRWRPIKSHGSTNQRLVTAREAAAFDIKQQERVASLKTAPASITSAPSQGESADQQQRCRRPGRLQRLAA